MWAGARAADRARGRDPSRICHASSQNRAALDGSARFGASSRHAVPDSAARPDPGTRPGIRLLACPGRGAGARQCDAGRDPAARLGSAAAGRRRAAGRRDHPGGVCADAALTGLDRRPLAAALRDQLAVDGLLLFFAVVALTGIAHAVLFYRRAQDATAAPPPPATGFLTAVPVKSRGRVTMLDLKDVG